MQPNSIPTQIVALMDKERPPYGWWQLSTIEQHLPDIGDRSSVRNALARLVKRGLLERSLTHCAWRLTPAWRAYLSQREKLFV